LERDGIVGRQREIARLDAALEAIGTSPPAGRTVIVGGEAGIGKSRLVAVVAETARTRGMSVLGGACLPTGSVPYAPFVEAIRELVRSVDPARLPAILGPGRAEIERLLPEIGGRPTVFPAEATEDDRTGQGRLFEAILAVIERRAREAPVVVIVEDLQWADDGTRALIAFLSRTLRQAPALLLITIRTDTLEPTDPCARLVAELERDPWVERLELGPLGKADIARLLRRYGVGGVASGESEAIADRTGGNPFFVEQLAATGAGALDRHLPPQLRDVLTARLADQPDPTRRVLRAAAVAGRRVDDRMLAVVLGMPESDVADALRPAIAHGILGDAGHPDGRLGGYAFRHVLLAEAASDELLHGERMRLHAAFGQELERRGEVGGVPITSSELAYHWVEAGDPARAIPALIRAGQAAEGVYAFVEAGRQYETALALWSMSDGADPAADRVTLIQRAAECAVLTGHYARAVELGREAIVSAELEDVATGRSDAIRIGLLHDRLRWFLWESGDRVAAEAAVAEALRLIPSEPPSAARARALGQAAGLRLLAGAAGDARHQATEAIAVARSAGALSEEAFGLGILGWAQAVTDDVEHGIATYREGLSIAERLGGVEGIALGHANLAALLDRVGRTEASLDAAHEGYEIARRLGVARTYGGGLLGHVAKALFDLGRWDEAAAAADEGLDLDPMGSAAIWLHVNRARVDTNQGRFDDAEEHLRQADELNAAGSGTDRYAAALASARVELASWQGQLDAVRRGAAAALATLDRSAPADPALAWLAWHALHAEAEAAVVARARHDPAAIGEVEAHVRPIADVLVGGQGRVPGSGDPRRTGLVGLCRGELARIRGASDPAAWDRTAEAWDAAGRPAPAAYARFRSAEARLAERGDRTAATTSLRAAFETSELLGAGPLRLEIERLARHARIELRAARSAAEEDPGADLGLTDRETEVIRLVAAGRSNQQIADALFITRKTASVHVSNILAKLGVANRVEAAAVAQRLGLTDDAGR
jgi:DNA-binding CsgD family transcriptional regulator